MKAIRIVDALGPNPAFDKAAAKAAKAKGEKYPISPDVTYRAGEVIEDPDCWILCVLATPVCRPEDDECKEKVNAYLNHPSRKSELAKLKRMASPSVFKDLPKGLQEYVNVVAKKWLPANEQPKVQKTDDVKTPAK